MKKLTNYTPGPRGVTLKSGEVVWIKPGATGEFANDGADEIVTTPDLGHKPASEADADDDVVAALNAEIADLKKKVSDKGGDALKAATKRADKADADLVKANADIDALKAAIAEQGKQIEELTKPA